MKMNWIVLIVLVILCVGCNNNDPLDVVPDLHILITSDPVIEVDCTDTVLLVGTVLGNLGLPSPNEPVSFEIVPGSATPSTLTGTFSPLPKSTDAVGLYSITFVLDQTECQNNCIGATACSLNIRATSDGIVSNHITISENL